MHILGVNGWDTGTHDSSACLFYNGKLIAAAEEERFTRHKKSFNSFPHNAISYCLNAANISPSEIDHVVFGWNVTELDNQYGSGKITLKECLEKAMPKNLFPREKEPGIHMYSHHVAHAAGAYYSSGYDQATILVIDGSGEKESITIAKGDNGHLEMIENYPIQHSLGIFYEALSIYVGLGRFNEGKTMGLSSYGDIEFEFPNILEGPPNFTVGDMKGDELYKKTTIAWIKYIREMTKLPMMKANYSYNELFSRMSNQVDVMPYKSLAASGQKALENAVVALVKQAIAKTGYSKVCISGGVGLNCVANRQILNLPEVEALYIQPPASDAGVCIGAAALFSQQNGMNPQIPPDHVYSGPSFSDGQIADLLRRYHIKYEVLNDRWYEHVTDLLHKNKVVARFSGRMELGPRALGNRSILANPKSREMMSRVNQIKQREQWRPFAPSITVENSAKLLLETTTSPYMLLNSTIKEEQRENVPAIVHVDGSTRPQVIDRDFNVSYWELLNCFAESTGVPALMNTSFNIGNEPIICSPNDAIRSFFCSDLDYLLLERFLITKK